jgi:hypothetical protein
MVTPRFLTTSMTEWAGPQENGIALGAFAEIVDDGD